MTEPFLSLVTHPFAVVPNVFGEALCAFPAGLRADLLPRLGIYRRVASKFRWDLDHRFADQNGNRIQIAGVTLQSQSLRFERQCSATCERVVKRGKFLPVE